MRPLRVIALAAILSGLGAVTASGGPPSEDVPLPGGTLALARAAGLHTPPDPARFAAEIIRLTHGTPEGRRDHPSSTLNRLLAHLDVAERFSTALAVVPEGTIDLAQASDPARRDRLRELLQLTGLRLRENRGRFSVEPDRTAAANAAMLNALGVDVGSLESKLNAGEKVRLALLSEPIPVPLTASWWGKLLGKPVPANQVFAAIVRNPRAALLAHGLAALDDETLALFEHSLELAGRLLDHSAAFAAFAGSLHVRNGRVNTPGGGAAEPLWERVIGEKADDPERFIRSLFSRHDGRVAYFYDVISELDASRASFALGFAVSDDASRPERFGILVESVVASVSDWQVADKPFSRPVDDVTRLLLNLSAEANGTLKGVVAQRFWELVFRNMDLPSADDAAGQMEGVERGGDINALWLVEAVSAGDPKLREARIRQLAFAGRVFSSASRASYGEVLTALRALPGYPALMLTLERAGVTDPAVYAAAARRAQDLSDLGDTKAFVALAQFQGGLSIVSTMAMSGAIDAARAASLAGTLVRVPLDDDWYDARVAAWVRNDLLPALPSRDDADRAIIAALAGVNASQNPAPIRVDWEGEQYRLDIAASEERRLGALRERQRTFSVDTALKLEQAARELAGNEIDLPAIQKTIASLRALQPSLVPWSTNAGKKLVFPAGVGELPDARAVVEDVVKDLSKITKPNDATKASGSAEALQELSGVVLADALSAMAYAVHLGNPEEGARLESDLSRRHDFGLALKEKSERQWTAWLVPSQVVQPGAPRRVVGSLFALDIAFANLALRRVSLDGPGGTPTLLSNDRETFTRSVALLNPHRLTDADRDRIAAAVARGRARVASLAQGAQGAESLGRVADEIKLDGWRRRAAQWEIDHGARRVSTLFSVNELLVLGGAGQDLEPWGTAHGPISGCLCTKLPASNAWRLVMGRPQIGAMSTAVPDVGLQVAVELSALKLPAALAKMVLGALMQEFVDRTRPNDPNDWLTLVRDASVIRREKIEDFVAAATARGPLVSERTYQGARP